MTEGIDLITQQAPAAEPRAYYTYDVPEKLAKQSAIKSITLVENTAAEELMATKRSGGDPIRLALELGKQAVVAINGRPVSAGDASLDSAWDKMHPKVRNLVMHAYNTLHANTKEDGEAFLATCVVTAK